MTYFHIGGTAAPEPEIACRSDAEWEALLDAHARNDVAAIMRLIASPPTMLPSASMRPLATEDLEKHADQFWKQYAERHGAANPAQHGEVSYSVAPNRADPKTNEVLRKVTEGGKS